MDALEALKALESAVSTFLNSTWTKEDYLALLEARTEANKAIGLETYKRLNAIQ